MYLMVRLQSSTLFNRFSVGSSKGQSTPKKAVVRNPQATMSKESKPVKNQEKDAILSDPLSSQATVSQTQKKSLVSSNPLSSIQPEASQVQNKTLVHSNPFSDQPKVNQVQKGLPLSSSTLVSSQLQASQTQDKPSANQLEASLSSPLEASQTQNNAATSSDRSSQPEATQTQEKSPVSSNPLPSQQESQGQPLKTDTKISIASVSESNQELSKESQTKDIPATQKQATSKSSLFILSDDKSHDSPTQADTNYSTEIEEGLDENVPLLLGHSDTDLQISEGSEDPDRKARWKSLDTLRGIAVLGMILVLGQGDIERAYDWMKVSSYVGFKPADMIEPIFFFLLGFTLYLKFEKNPKKLRL